MGSLGVALVIVPVITSLTEDAPRAVPEDLRVASYGLGATRWPTIAGVTVPAAVSGISAALILGMGRALGETMIVAMATGNAGLITLNPFSRVRTHNMPQAARVSDATAFLSMGRLVEFDRTHEVLATPAKKETKDYITGRFG